MMNEFKIDMGKRYIPRNRPDIKYIRITNGIMYSSPRYLGEIVYEDSESAFTYGGHWAEDGTSATGNTSLDLIAEYVEPSLDLSLDSPPPAPNYEQVLKDIWFDTSNKELSDYWVKYEE